MSQNEPISHACAFPVSEDSRFLGSLSPSPFSDSDETSVFTKLRCVKRDPGKSGLVGRSKPADLVVAR